MYTENWWNYSIHIRTFQTTQGHHNSHSDFSHWQKKKHRSPGPFRFAPEYFIPREGTLKSPRQKSPQTDLQNFPVFLHQTRSHMRTLYESQKSYDRRDGCDWCDTCDMCNLGKNDATKFDGYEREKFSPHNMAQNPIYHFRNSHKLQIPQMQRHACDNTRRTWQRSTYSFPLTKTLSHRCFCYAFYIACEKSVEDPSESFAIHT